jgi:flagellar basal body P-ring protein FlgI
LGVGLTQEQFDEAFTESMKNPEFKNKTDEQSKVIFEEELKKQVKESVKNKTPEIVSELKEIGYNGTDIISLTDKYMILDKKYLINELLKQLLKN